MSNEQTAVRAMEGSGWGRYGPISVLRHMDDFKNVAISSRELEATRKAGRPVRHSTCLLTIADCGYRERLSRGAGL